jgi:hypothetical protein
MREFRSIPDPSGSLQPPRRYPPTAVGVATPEPEPVPPRRTRFAGLWASNPSVFADALRDVLGVPAWIGRSVKELLQSGKIWHRGRFPRRPGRAL